VQDINGGRTKAVRPQDSLSTDVWDRFPLTEQAAKEVGDPLEYAHKEIYDPTENVS
jgi:hypothetical protein